MVVDQSAHPQPQHMNDLKYLVCMEWMWEPFHVGLGPQPIHASIICSLAVTQEISQLPKFWADKYCGSGMMVDPSVRPQHINGLKHLVYVCSGCGNHSIWVLGLIQRARGRKLEIKLA